MSRYHPRVLVDANVLISFLLPSDRTIRTVTLFIERIVVRDVLNVLPMEVLDELRSTIAGKRKLHSRIPADALEAFVSDLRLVSTPAKYVPPPYPSVVRDANDDYLMAYALSENVDYLVTYDADLLSVTMPEGGPRIVTPPTLLDILDRLKQGPPDR